MKGGTIVGLCKQYVLLSCIWWAFYLIFQPSSQCLFLLKSFLCHMFYGLFQSEKRFANPTSTWLDAAVTATSFETRSTNNFYPSPMKTLSTNSFTSFKLILCCVSAFLRVSDVWQSEGEQISVNFKNKSFANSGISGLVLCVVPLSQRKYSNNEFKQHRNVITITNHSTCQSSILLMSSHLRKATIVRLFPEKQSDLYLASERFIVNMENKKRCERFIHYILVLSTWFEYYVITWHVRIEKDFSRNFIIASIHNRFVKTENDGHTTIIPPTLGR